MSTRTRTPTQFLAIAKHGVKFASSLTAAERVVASRFVSKRMPRKLLPYQRVTFKLRPAVTLRLGGVTHPTRERAVDEGDCQTLVIDDVFEVSSSDDVPSDCELVEATPVSDDEGASIIMSFCGM